jgi:putative transposase
MSHRYRAYPTGTIESQLLAHCWDDRAVWNVAVEQFRQWRPGRRSSPNRADRAGQLTEAREHIEWLREGSSSVQQQALRIFDEAVKNFFAGTHGRPSFRGRYDKLGFTIRDVKVRKLSRRWSEVQIPKHGDSPATWVRFRRSRPLPARYGMARVTRDRSGRWHVSFTAEQVPVEREGTGVVVGVDRGVANTVAYSEAVDGDSFEHCPQLRAKEAERKLRLERRLARQQPGSNRRARTKRQLARLAAREADRAKDWVEKTTTKLIRHADTIVIEDLQIKNMIAGAAGSIDEPGTNVRAKAGLNRSLARSRLSMFARRLRDKADASGVALIEVPAAHTSQTCAACGHVASENRESQAVFECVACGHTAHADTNAAIVIRERGIELAPAQGQGVAARRDLQPPGGSPKREAQTEHGPNQAAA